MKIRGAVLYAPGMFCFFVVYKNSIYDGDDGHTGYTGKKEQTA
jgi:hypothetical protein